MHEFHFSKTTTFDIDTIVALEKEDASFILPNTKDEHLNLIEDENVDHLLFRSIDNEIIGFVILVGKTNMDKSIEFRRIVIKEKGKGYGRKALKAIKAYCFEILKCYRMWLDVLESNLRARSLYKSEGFKDERMLSDAVLIGDNYHNLILMSLHEDEHREASEK